MSDHERGAYTPPTDSPLTFDARQPVRGDRPVPFTLIISILVLVGLAGAIAWFYHQGVRRAGQPPQTVGSPVADIKAPPPAEAQPQDPAAGLQIYKTEGGKSVAATAPQFTPPPEEPAARPGVTPAPAPPTLVLSPASPSTPSHSATVAPALRPSIPAQPPAPAKALPVAKPVQLAKAEPPPAPKPTPRAEPAGPSAKAPAPTPAKPAAAKSPAPAAAASGAAAVQIGAFSSQALADKGWSDAAAIAPGAAAGKGKNVEKVDKDGKTLFRTQVTGFSSRADATAFCEKLKAAGKACFVK